MLSRIARSPYVIAVAVFVGLAVRIFLTLRSGNQAEGVLGGGSDAPAYILLGKAIAAGHGMTYVGQPTALRAPLYPLMLAALQILFGSQSLLVMRFVQCGIAVLTAWVCAKTAVLLWGEAAKWPAFAIAICIPTLLFFTTQIIAEAFTTFFVALFLLYLVQYCAGEQSRPLIGMSVCAGILLLLRFNTVYLPVVAALAIVHIPFRVGNIKRAILPLAISLVFVAPWIIRNIIVFDGGILYSSQTGTTLLHGVLAPDGRTQPEGRIAIQEHHSWTRSAIETDKPTRLQYPSEVEMNRQARAEAIRVWSQVGFGIFPLLAKKIGYFWLSTDQLLETHSFPGWQRLIRAAGVFIYWGVLTAAIFGWLRIKKVAPRVAWLLLAYCLIVTLLHLPVTMSTRLRVPLVDPILCVLAGIAVSPVSAERRKSDSVPTAPAVLA